jgi:hypothetical protein
MAIRIQHPLCIGVNLTCYKFWAGVVETDIPGKPPVSAALATRAALSLLCPRQATLHHQIAHTTILYVQSPLPPLR